VGSVIFLDILLCFLSSPFEDNPDAKLAINHSILWNQSSFLEISDLVFV